MAKKQKQAAKPKRSDRQPLQPAAKAFTTALAAAFGLRFLLSETLPPEWRFWGVDYLEYIDGDKDVLLALALPLIFAIPAVTKKLSSLFPSKESMDMKPVVGAGVVLAGAYAVLMMLEGFVFPFLGDGSVFAGEVFRIINVDGFESVIVKPSAYLAGKAVEWYALAFEPADNTAPFVVSGVAGFAVMLAAWLYFLRKETANIRLMVLALLVSSGAMLLFTGYVELYALPYAFTVAFFLAAWESIRRDASIVLPGVLLAIAIAFGAAAAVFIPAYVLMLLTHGKSGELALKKPFLALTGLMFAVIIIGYVVIGTDVISQYLIPIVPTGKTPDSVMNGIQSYTLFAPAHLIDIINALLLNGTLALFSIFGIAALARPEGFWSDRLTAAFALASVGGVLLLLVGNTYFGMARDWDITAIPITAVLFLAAAMLVRADESGKLSLRAVLPLLLIGAVALTYPWMKVNHDEPRAAERFSDILAMDADVLLPVNTFTGYEHLAEYYSSAGMRNEYLDALERLVETGHSIDATLNTFLSEAIDPKHGGEKEAVFQRLWDAAYTAAQKVADDDTQIRRIREAVVGSFVSAESVGAGQGIDGEISRFKAVFPSWPELSIYTALLDPAMDPAARYEQAAEGLSEETENAYLYMVVGELAQRSNQIDRAAQHFDSALSLEPNKYPSWYLSYARMMYESGRVEQAKQILRECMEQSRGTKEAETARQVLQSWGG